MDKKQPKKLKLQKLIMIYKEWANLRVGFFNGKRFESGIDSGFGDHHILDGFIAGVSLGSFNLSYNVHAFNNFAENNMSAVQPGSFLDSDEELGSVGVFASVGHGQPSGTVMLELEVFVGETLAVDGTSTGTYKWKLFRWLDR